MKQRVLLSLSVLLFFSALYVAPADSSVSPSVATLGAKAKLATQTDAGPRIVAKQEPATVALTRCEIRCRREYEQCKIFCSKNPCLVACETVLELCLSNCGSDS
jgi:hypothetical protein